jgi:hypothetical protein
MRKAFALVALLSATFSLSSALGHNGEDAKSADRPCYASSDPVVVEQDTDSNGADFIGVCTDYGVVRAGVNFDEESGFIAADGSPAAGSEDPADEDNPAEWGDGYLLLTGNSEGAFHVYCAGNGDYEDGAQPDDELAPAGDCLNPPM